MGPSVTEEGTYQYKMLVCMEEFKYVSHMKFKNILKRKLHTEQIPLGIICNLFGLWTAKTHLLDKIASEMPVPHSLGKYF